MIKIPVFIHRCTRYRNLVLYEDLVGRCIGIQIKRKKKRRLFILTLILKYNNNNSEEREERRRRKKRTEIIRKKKKKKEEEEERSTPYPTNSNVFHEQQRRSSSGVFYKKTINRKQIKEMLSSGKFGRNCKKIIKLRFLNGRRHWCISIPRKKEF